MSRKFEIVGSAFLDTASCAASGARCPSPISVSQIASNAIHVPERTINSPVTWIDLLTANGFSEITGLLLNVASGSIELRVSSDLAVDQVIPVSGFHGFASKTVGTELTAVAVRGVGTFELMLAGT